jgi:hypothetical protein
MFIMIKVNLTVPLRGLPEPKVPLTPDTLVVNSVNEVVNGRVDRRC